MDYFDLLLLGRPWDPENYSYVFTCLLQYSQEYSHFEYLPTLVSPEENRPSLMKIKKQNSCLQKFFEKKDHPDYH